MRKIYYLATFSDLGQRNVLGHAVIQNCLPDKEKIRIDLFLLFSVIPGEVRLFLYSPPHSLSAHEPGMMENPVTDLEIPLSLCCNAGNPCFSGYFPVVSDYWFELVLPNDRLQFGTKPVSIKQSNHPVPTPIVNTESKNNYRNSDNIISQNSISLWDRLTDRFGSSSYFSNQYEGISLTPSEIHRFTIQDQSLEENSFLLHGYYQYKHILLLRSNSFKQEPSYCIGVPGIWQKQEKIVAGMFGFSSFKSMDSFAEKKMIRQPLPPSGTFGYYLRKISFSTFLFQSH